MRGEASPAYLGVEQDKGGLGGKAPAGWAEKIGGGFATRHIISNQVHGLLNSDPPFTQWLIQDHMVRQD